MALLGDVIGDARQAAAALDKKRLVAERIADWRADPRKMVAELWPHVTPDPWQSEVLRAFATEPQIAMKACKGPGKTTTLAWCGWNFLLTRPHPKGAASSITGDNLYDGLWTELAMWRGQSAGGILDDLFGQNTDRIFLKSAPETWWLSARTWPKTADAQAQASSLAGLHARHIFILLDEVSDYPTGILVTAQAIASTKDTEARLVVAGNPTRAEGPLWTICQTAARSDWYVVVITGDPDDPQRSPRIDVEWARKLIALWGREHAWVKVNVLGEFPDRPFDKLFSADELERCVRRAPRPELYSREARILGVDVAYFGDDRSVFQPRQGPVAFPAKVYRKQDTMYLAEELARAYERWPFQVAFIDLTGIGAGTHDRAKQLGVPIVGIYPGGGAAEERFENKRAEIWFRTADWVKDAAIPNDPELIAELCAPSYKISKKGRLQLEAKEDLKKRGLASPDKADALTLTFAQPVLPPDLAHALPGSRAAAHRNVAHERGWRS